MTHHLVLDDIHLFYGSHGTRLEGVCLLEAVAWWAEEEHTDHPACVSPALAAFGRRLNDILPDGKRQELVRYIPLMAGTAGDGKDGARVFMAADWAVRTCTPMWLELADLAAEAAALRALPRVTSIATARIAETEVRKIHTKTRVAADAAAAAYAAYAAAAAAAAYAAADAAARIRDSAIELLGRMINPAKKG